MACIVLAYSKALSQQASLSHLAYFKYVGGMKSLFKVSFSLKVLVMET
jgi:hypothetical protein